MAFPLTTNRQPRTEFDHPRVNQALADALLVACPDCDLLQRLPVIAPGASACCPRCDKELWRPREDSLNRTLPLALAALVLYVIANSVPMLGLSVAGHQASTTVMGGAEQLWDDGQRMVAVLVVFTVVIAPALQICFLNLILLGVRREHPRPWVGKLLRHVHVARVWSMFEVMLLGVLVALTKIADYATVIPGLALFTLFALVLLLAAIECHFDPREVWNRVAWTKADAVAKERRPAAGTATDFTIRGEEMPEVTP
jgi:paraquat-inducible protein A